MFFIELPVFLWAAVVAAISIYFTVDARRITTTLIGLLLPYSRKKIAESIPRTKGIEIFPLIGAIIFTFSFPEAIHLLLPLLWAPLLIGGLGLLIRCFIQEFYPNPYKGFWYWVSIFVNILMLICTIWVLGLYVQLFDASIGWAVILVSGLLTLLLSSAAGSAAMLTVSNNQRRWIGIYLLNMITILILYPLLCHTFVDQWPWLIMRWTNFFNLPWLWPAPIICLGSLIFIGFHIYYRRWVCLEVFHGFFNLGVFYAIGASIWPYLIPPILNIWDVQSSDEIQTILVFFTILAFPAAAALVVKLNFDSD